MYRSNSRKQLFRHANGQVVIAPIEGGNYDIFGGKTTYSEMIKSGWKPIQQSDYIGPRAGMNGGDEAGVKGRHRDYFKELLEVH